MPLGGLMLIMSILAMIGLRLVNGKQDPSNEMPLAA
jgi:DHA1 family 2-module integral membrane pump EmrD-like MFS transporter